MQIEQLIKKLNSPYLIARKIALYRLCSRQSEELASQPAFDASRINLNVHSDNSFAPYSPALAAYMAYRSGLRLASLCDYGTMTGGKEFAECCEKLRINTVNGFELMVHSDNLGKCIAAFYCIPGKVKDSPFLPLLEKFREICFSRVKIVCDKINGKLKKHGLFIDFDKDIIHLSKAQKGGTLTLKHLYMAAGEKIIQKCGKGAATADFLRSSLCLDIDESIYNLLCDPHNPFYIYDLIMALRDNFSDVTSDLTPPSLATFMSLAGGGGIVKAYQYDCKSNWIKNETESEQTLETFRSTIEIAKNEGFNAVCISAKNLSSSLLCRFVDVLKENELLAIFTEKTEYPRNHFECAVPPDAKNYIETCAYAMLGNSICLAKNESDGLFNEEGAIKDVDFAEKLRIYSNIGRNNL